MVLIIMSKILIHYICLIYTIVLIDYNYWELLSIKEVLKDLTIDTPTAITKLIIQLIMFFLSKNHKELYEANEDVC